MAAQSVGKDNVALGDFLQLINQRKALVGLLFFLVLVTALGVTALMPKWYLAVTKIRVERPEGEMKLFQSAAAGYYDPIFQQDQFRILQSEKILYPVIERLHLRERFSAEMGSAGALPVSAAYHYLATRMLRIDAQRGSSIIDIGVLSRNPALAAEIANEIAAVYASDRISEATTGQGSGLARLRGELEAQERAVSAQRDVVERLRKDLNISGVDLNARHSDMEIETLRQMQNTLIALRVDTIGRKTRWERFKAIPATERINLINSELIQDSNIQNLLQAYLVADQNVARLRARLGEAHPELIAAMDSKAKMREQLDAQLQGYESALEIAYNEAQARVTELETQLAQARVDQILSARERLRPFEEAAQKLEDETKLLSTLKLTLRQREIDFQVPKRSIEVLNTAEVPSVPSKPNWTVNTLAAVVIGLILGVGAAVLLEHFDRSFRSVSDIEARLLLPVLSVLPRTLEAGPVDLSDMGQAEPFRVLHTNIRLGIFDEKPRAYMMCSAGPGEGKSTAIHNLVRLAASTGERVVLIDADLRRPVQHELFAAPRKPGLGEYLAGTAELEAIVQKELLPGLDFIPAGAVADFTLGLAGAPRLARLIEEMKRSHSLVFFDAPPVIGVSDTSVLARAMDGILFLVQYRRNPESMVLRAKSILTSLGAPLSGVILNRVPQGSGEDYDYYTGNYAYYSGQGKTTKRRTESETRSAERLVFEEPKPSSQKNKKSC